MSQFSVDDLEIHPSALLVFRDGVCVELTSIEFTLLTELILVAGKVADRDTLSRKVLGRKYLPSDRSLDNHVSHICRKLGPAIDGRRRIISVRGKGYIDRCFQPVKMMQTPQAGVGKLAIAVEKVLEESSRSVRSAG